jgi:hypothetical protein
VKITAEKRSGRMTVWSFHRRWIVKPDKRLGMESRKVGFCLHRKRNYKPMKKCDEIQRETVRFTKLRTCDTRRDLRISQKFLNNLRRNAQNVLEYIV